ncbi:VF530 family DNA-binding protein [Rhizobacter sp. LjRoot28]|uniref:VF530 family protein n=1 Tax=Rhizobacter sp. LjRoot28 TaxID=3342309 RepID=UPI003ED06A80
MPDHRPAEQDALDPAAASAAPVQARNPLHGVTLERILNELVEFGGWDGLAGQVNIRCFTHDPSVASSLKFLRRTPWARAKVESLYLFMLREKARRAKAGGGR